MRDPAPSSKLELYLVTGTDFHVPWVFANLIQTRVSAVMPFLMPDSEYTPAQLLGLDLWSALNSAEARMAGLVIAGLAKRGELDLTLVGSDAEGAAAFMRSH